MKPLRKKIRKLTIKMLFVVVIIGLWYYYATPKYEFVIAGGVAVILGEIIRLWAAGHLRKNKKVVTTGPYAYVKNPLYIGTWLIMTGLCVMASNWWILGIGFVVFIIYYAPYKMKVEYARLEERFGEDFVKYNKTVPDYFPKLKRYNSGDEQKWAFECVKNNEEHLTCISTMCGIVLIVLKFYNIL